jgi:dienelactone hydrolase
VAGLPILGGPNDVIEFFAKYFAERGISTVIVHREEKYQEIENVEAINPAFQQMILDHRQVLDWIGQQPELDATRIGAFGISMGGIKAVLIAGSDSRVKATVVALAGGDLADILVTSAEDGIQERVAELLLKHNMTREELEREIRSELIFDPLDFAPAINPKTTLQIITLFDKVVPTGNQLQLRKALGNPQTIMLPTGHYGAILYILEIRMTAARFFSEHL